MWLSLQAPGDVVPVRADGSSAPSVRSRSGSAVPHHRPCHHHHHLPRCGVHDAPAPGLQRCRAVDADRATAPDIRRSTASFDIDFGPFLTYFSRISKARWLPHPCTVHPLPCMHVPPLTRRSLLGVHVYWDAVVLATPGSPSATAVTVTVPVSGPCPCLCLCLCCVCAVTGVLIGACDPML